MMKPLTGWKQACLLTAVSLTVFAAVFLLQPVDPVMGQLANSSKSLTAAKSDLPGDIKLAIQLIEKKDFRTFLELYCPVEMLRKLRQQDLVDRAATVLASQPKTKAYLLALFNSLQVQTAKFDKSGGIATLEMDPKSPIPDEIPGELNIAEIFELKLTGLGSDLSRVITEATKLLEEPNVTEFVDRVFPASELARLQTPDSRQTLLLQFKETPEMAKSIVADLKILATIKPEISKDGKEATFSVLGGEPSIKREIKFQKVGNDWRLFDDSPRIATELTRQAKLVPGATSKVVQMERIGGNWRFIELPALRMDGP
ncbi:MAG: hypothetical protein WCJ09_13950 [Planctomycetota bacterium]